MRSEVCICQRERGREREEADARMRCTLTIFNRIYLFFRMQWHSYMFAIWNICWFFVVLWPWCLSNSQKQILYGSKNAFRVCKCERFCVSLSLSLSVCMWECAKIVHGICWCHVCECIHLLWMVFTLAPSCKNLCLRKISNGISSASNDVRFN